MFGKNPKFLLPFYRAKLRFSSNYWTYISDIQTDNEDLQVGDHSGNISKSYTLDAEDQR